MNKKKDKKSMAKSSLENLQKVYSDSADSGVSCSDESGQQFLRVTSIEELNLPGPPDGGWGWVICFACFACNFVLDGIAYSFGVMLEALVTHFDSSRSAVSWVGSLLAGVYMLSGPIVGGIVNKYGMRTACISGAILSCIGIGLSTLSPNVPVLMLTYGVMGGFGIGLIYLPAVIACGYYFEKRRALATGISVCGSGVGCFAFAPLANVLLEEYGWQGANLIFAGLCLNCAVFGGLMRPLELVVESPNKSSKHKRGSYVTVVSPDLIVTPPSIEVDPPDDDGQGPTQYEEITMRHLGGGAGSILQPYPHAISQIPEEDEDRREDSSTSLAKTTVQVPKQNLRVPNHRRFSSFAPRTGRTRTVSESPYSGRGLEESPNFEDPNSIQFKRNISTPGFGRIETLNSISEDGSQVNYFTLGVNGGSRIYLQPQSHSGSRILVRPMARKDVFYSGSIFHLDTDVQADAASPAQLSERHHSVSSHRLSIQRRGSIIASHLSIPQDDFDPDPLLQDLETESRPLMSALLDMIDIKLLKNPFFLLICLSNIFGFLALYIPYVYLPDMAVNTGISPEKASFIISIIGISNTLGRFVTGAFVDLPWVSSLIVTNCSLILSGISVISFPFCDSYTSFVVVALLLGLFVSAYISLTSIVLVDLLGLDSLTSSFGLLVLCRGLASMVGPPLAGALFDATGDYDSSFYMAGAFLICAGLISVGADILWRQKRSENKHL